ncbi:hypothetical protein E2C01_099244 [Portunus trituberculatus]|uniref:Uncharacterized protein n=1 Tax=Portunus trituberculatus TaxID=210409 RepID=A0A5B7JZU6_PORTR|nr:hypothetical protein [Portunus trituberculatus]
MLDKEADTGATGSAGYGRKKGGIYSCLVPGRGEEKRREKRGGGKN